MVCSYTLFKYRFSAKINAKSGMCLTMCREPSPLNKQTKEWTKCLILQKRLLRKKFKQHFLSALQNNKVTQNSGSVFAERIEKAKKTKFESELIKIVDCFPACHGNYDSNLVSFRVKSLKQTLFFIAVSKSTQKNKMVIKNEVPN